MTKQLGFFIVYIGLVLMVLFTQLTYKYYIFVSFTIIWISYAMFNFYKQSTKKLSGEFIFKFESKPVRIFILFLAVFITIGYIIKGSFSLLQIFMFWMLVIVDTCIYLITRKLKPISFIIDGTHLIYNDHYKTTRDLSALTSISLNGWNEDIKLKFSNDKPISINRDEFKIEDMHNLVSICIERSNNDLILSENIKFEISMREANKSKNALNEIENNTTN